MNQLNNLSDDADQLIYYALPDGTVATLQFTYRSAIQRWSVSVVLGGVTINGLILCVAPNVLRQWKNLISMGMAVTSTDGQDPVSIDDFTTGRIKVLMLTPEEMKQVESDIIGAAA